MRVICSKIFANKINIKEEKDIIASFTLLEQEIICSGAGAS